MLRIETTLFSLVFAALLLPACGGDSGEPMTHKLEEFETEVNVLDAMAADHSTAIEAAADLSAVSVEELGYATNTDGHHEMLHHMIMELGECEHDGQTADTGAMGTTIEDIEAELADHATAMSAVADTAEAVAEEARHQGALDTLIAALIAAHDAMVAVGDEFMCAAHHE